MLKVIDAPADNSFLNYGKNTLKRVINTNINQVYEKLWHKNREVLINEDGKLRTYLKIKTHFGFEKYLELINSFQNRKCVTKFRISQHKLKIEIGRYTKPFTPANQRICDKCNLNSVEDELHHFHDCPRFVNARDELFQYISISNKKFQRLSPSNKLYWVFNCENQNILLKTSVFLLEAGCVS